MLRFTPLLLLASCGIFGMSADQQEALARYQRNASTYYGGGRFDQALDQVRRGLELDPDDYKLKVIRGWCLLRQSTGDARLLQLAVEQFDEVLELRSRSEQSGQARLGHGVSHGRRGLGLLQAAQRRREDAHRLGLIGSDLAAREAAAAKLEQAAREDFDVAEASLVSLIDTGEELLEAHFHLIHLRAWHNDYLGAVQHGNAYLERVTALQDEIRQRLERTLMVDYERELRIRLQNRIDQELEVRAFLANLHYKEGHHELVVEQLDLVLLKNPQLYNEYFNRGRSLLAVGRAEDGKRDLEKFLATTQLPRENAQVQEALHLLASL